MEKHQAPGEAAAVASWHTHTRADGSASVARLGHTERGVSDRGIKLLAGAVISLITFATMPEKAGKPLE